MPRHRRERAATIGGGRMLEAISGLVQLLLLSGVVSLLLWEGFLKPRRDRKAIAAMLEVEVEANLARLVRFRRNLKADPTAVPETEPHSIIYAAVARELPVLADPAPRMVVEFYQELAHMEVGLTAIRRIQKEKEAGSRKADEADQHRIEVLRDIDGHVEHAIARGARLLDQLGRQAERRHTEGTRNSGVSSLDLEFEDRLRNHAELRDRIAGRKSRNQDTDPRQNSP
jgi:hypothetical protein